MAAAMMASHTTAMLGRSLCSFLTRRVFSTLLDDPRIHDIAASILGDDFNYMGSDGNFYVGDTAGILTAMAGAAV